MPYPIEEKLVIGVASSALFDLSVSDDIYQTQGVEAYRQHQEQNLDEPFPSGVALPFIRRFLSINKAFPDQLPVEVVLLSRNSPETGLRVFRSISHYQLDITRAAFMSGRSPYEYIPAFNASLFLSANEEDVQKAIDANYLPGGYCLRASTMMKSTLSCGCLRLRWRDCRRRGRACLQAQRQPGRLSGTRAHAQGHPAFAGATGRPLPQAFADTHAGGPQAGRGPDVPADSAHCHRHGAQRAFARASSDNLEGLGRIPG